MERLKNEENQIALEDGVIELLKFRLALICAHFLLSYSDLEQFENVMTSLREPLKNVFQSILVNVDNKYNMPQVLGSLLDNIDDCISSCPRSTSMTEEELDFLLLNLHYLSKYAEQMFPLSTQLVMLQNMCGNMKDFNGLIVNGCIDQDIVKYVLPQFQLLAERVGFFLWVFHMDQSGISDSDSNDKTDENAHLSMLNYLLLKIVPVEFEFMHICYTNLKSSTSAEVGRFIKQLLETFPDILREYLIHLQEYMVTIINPNISGARDIHFMMEFLLIILTDMPTDLIHHDTFFDHLARVGELTREVVSTLVWDFGDKSMIKECIKETTRTTVDLLKDIELLKGDLRHVYLKSPDSCQKCFPMSDGPLFMHLLLRHLKDLLDSSAYSIALIKEEIGQVKVDLEFIISFFVDIEEELYKDLWERVLNVAFEAKDVIDSIIVRDNCLLHLIFSLPVTIKKIKLIKEDISNLLENSQEQRARCCFEEETNWIMRKLTSGPADLDVISITGMPGSEKRAFGNESCPDDLLDVGKEIAENCKGLPLVADLVAGVIAGREKKKTLWFEVQNNLSSFILNGEVDVMKISCHMLTIDYNREFFGLNNFVPFDPNKKRYSSKHLYSLSIEGDQLDNRLSDICQLRHLRLLRVLNLDPSFIMVKDSLLNEICMLNNLRFLQTGTKVKSLPLSFSNLWNLEFLAVYNEGSTLINQH
ncbi:uncharacterized protein LOC125851559 [Solanum stenotomum]|uniref:uncharacterized protein LOC125851559 n=1 Tax=Solanum stenotomum TaxID=172797 RepID=UPI0020D174DC|nr:uncharacterized protein LOC125851559 [Solanum stenotomum]